MWLGASKSDRPTRLRGRGRAPRLRRGARLAAPRRPPAAPALARAAHRRPRRLGRVARARSRPPRPRLAWGAAAGGASRRSASTTSSAGLLTAPLLGAGSLLRADSGAGAPVALVYAGLAAGVALAVPLEGSFGAEAIPEAQEHLDLFPARILASLGNTLGTLAVVGVAVATFRRRPLGNALVLAGVVVAAAGSALFGLGIAGTAASLALAAALLYAGFVVRASPSAAVAPRERHHTQPHSATIATSPLTSSERADGLLRGRGRPSVQG